MKILKTINPLSCAKISAIIYGMLSLIFIPFMLIGILFFKNGQPNAWFMLFFILLYPILGFIGGWVGASVYNLGARWVGGIEVEVEDK